MKLYFAASEEMEKLDELAVKNGLSILQMMELAGWHMVSLFNLLKKMPVKISRTLPRKADVVIDALIGYHLDGAPRGKFKEAIEWINGLGKKVISYDLPSGIDATTGQCFSPCIRASATLTLALPKRAFLKKSARKASGKILLVDIGIPEFLYDKIKLGSRPDFPGTGLLEIKSNL